MATLPIFEVHPDKTRGPFVTTGRSLFVPCKEPPMTVSTDLFYVISGSIGESSISQELYAILGNGIATKLSSSDLIVTADQKVYVQPSDQEKYEIFGIGFIPPREQR